MSGMNPTSGFSSIGKPLQLEANKNYYDNREWLAFVHSIIDDPQQVSTPEERDKILKNALGSHFRASA